MPLVLAPPSGPAAGTDERLTLGQPDFETVRNDGSSLSAPANMLLARTPIYPAPAAAPLSTHEANVAPVHREVNVTEPAVSPAPTGRASGDHGQETAQLAEKVFAMLERRLLVERERGGFRRI